ncbi:DsbA family protein [Actinomyces ruminicola]|uniref:DsbA family protein n=1 Tax=Actinomyces ruminicola TaxID=332524 RepID=UPI0011CCD5B1|nr:DsbA family protein [Actinomyces ruminicola]
MSVATSVHEAPEQVGPKALITQFTDPMMGLSWECEPALRRVETHFPGAVDFDTAMGLLVRDVSDFMTPAERTLDAAAGIRAYNARLADIYREEEPLAGMPINMEGFSLFSPARRSSLPLNLAYEAVRLIAPGQAERFLYRLRFATVVECRPTTATEELVEVVRACGLDIGTFLAACDGPAARAALRASLERRAALGIRGLLAFMISYGDVRMLLGGVCDYDALAAALERVSGGRLHPAAVSPTTTAVDQLLAAHPLLSDVEIGAALDLSGPDQARDLAAPLLDAGRARLLQAPRGWFIERV